MKAMRKVLLGLVLMSSCTTITGCALNLGQVGQAISVIAPLVDGPAGAAAPAAPAASGTAAAGIAATGALSGDKSSAAGIPLGSATGQAVTAGAAGAPGFAIPSLR